MYKIRKLLKEIDWTMTIVPFILIMSLCAVIMIEPEVAKNVIDKLRFIFGDKAGLYYSLLGSVIFILTMIIAFSKYGQIKLGKEDEKPKYSSFKWGAMIFTSTMAADILFYSFCEWALYANEPYIQSLGETQKWAPTFPLFHWGPIAWGFYIILAVAFGFMLHVRKRNKQKFSEACRPLIGDKVDGITGKIIDLIAIFALLAGTATTFSLATPLITDAIGEILNITTTVRLTISVLVIIALIYTFAILFGIKGISKLANICVYLFLGLLIYFLVLGRETIYILETGYQSIGNMIQNFVGMMTYIDPLRENSFPQNWTIYYWAYWMVWCVATPFFIGSISKGRKIKEIILGGYGWGILGTFTSFIVLGNYGLAQQLKHGLDISGSIAKGIPISEVIITIFETIPLHVLGLVLLILTMIAFYATTFDSLAIVMSAYSYKKLELDKEPHKLVRVFWSIMFIILPIALIFSENTIKQLQSVSIIAAFPIGIIIILIIISFFKDAKKYLNNKNLD